MIYKILITAQAEADIREAFTWWRDHRSVEQAERWLNKIYPAIATLIKFPHRCPHAPETDLIPAGLCELHFGVSRKTTHRIVYTIDGDSVIILRVRHVARQDLTAEDISL